MRVCVCLLVRLRVRPASREQETTGVVSARITICLKTVKRFSVHQRIIWVLLEGGEY